MIDTHFIWSFVDVVFQLSRIPWLLYSLTSKKCIINRCSPPFQTFHKLVNTSIRVRVTNFHTLWPKNWINCCCWSLLHNGEAMLDVSRCYQYSESNEGRFTSSVPVTLSVLKTSLSRLMKITFQFLLSLAVLSAWISTGTGRLEFLNKDGIRIKETWYGFVILDAIN
jgi:hypothetical protein